MTRRQAAIGALLCALPSLAVAQSVSAPAGVSVPASALAFGAKDSAATFVDATHPLPVTAAGAAFAASGKVAVASTFSATGQSAAFSPAGGRLFNASLWGTFVGSVQLERTFDGQAAVTAGTATWLPITAGAAQLYAWTAPASEQAVESETGVLYRLNCTAFTSGLINYRISQ